MSFIKAVLLTVLCFPGFSLVASATTIDFTGLTGNAGPFTAFTENGFSVSVVQGTFYVAGYSGDPAPSIAAFGTAPATIRITRAGGEASTFTTDSFDAMVSGGSGDVILSGYLNGYDIFQFGVLNDTTNGFVTYSQYPEVVDAVTIQFMPRPSANILLDNIVVNPVGFTPEPSSFLLLGTGLLGVAWATRRRVA